MHAVDSLRAGNISESMEELKAQIKADPSDPKQRVFLFQLLSVAGDWDRALTQLNVAGDMDPANLPMVQTYREALSCEALRDEVFAGNRQPLIFGDPEQWIAMVLEALKLAAQGDVTGSQRLREQAFEDATMTSGSIDGQEFEWIADADPRIGPFLEAIINGRYYWVPFIASRKFAWKSPKICGTLSGTRRNSSGPMAVKWWVLFQHVTRARIRAKIRHCSWREKPNG